MSRQRRLRFQDRVLMPVLVAVMPAWTAGALLLWNWDASATLRWTLLALITLPAAIGMLAVRQRVVHPLQALANLLEALREGDYSLRGRNVDPDDAVGEVMVELNSLSGTLQDQRFEALEAGVLLEKVIAEIDIAVFAFDVERRLRLVNRAGESLLIGNAVHHADRSGAEPGDRSAADLRGRTAVELGLAPMLDAPSGRIVPHVFPGATGRWEIRRRGFREGGRPHELLVISELSHALREEERQAWRRLVRVMGHELNSSLAPIKSMAGTLQNLIDREPAPSDWREDAHAGLTIIRDRADALGRFIGAYARLARLPPPTRRRAELAPLVRRAASLHGECVTVEAGPDLSLDVDADQIEQVLINLIKNAVEAAGDAGGVRVRWRVANDNLLAEVEDAGPGLARTDNLWVPFFTTKPGGTGIGLVLSREIVENHGGTISLENRADAPGCIARITLPMAPEKAEKGSEPFIRSGTEKGL